MRESRERRYPTGHTVHICQGRGPAVLLLNGCGLASAGWGQVVAALPGRRVLAVDRPGRCGTRCLGPPSLVGEVSFLRDLLRQESGDGKGGAIVVAHSMASFQAEALARLHPGLLGGVVLVDPSIASPRARGRAAAGPMSRAVQRLLGVGRVRGVAAAAFRAGLRSETVHPGAIATRAWRECWGDERALGAAVSEWLAYPSQAAELIRLRRGQESPSPVRAVILEAPPFADPRGMASLRVAFRGSRLRRLPASRHLMMLDAPSAIVEEILAMTGP